MNWTMLPSRMSVSVVVVLYFWICAVLYKCTGVPINKTVDQSRTKSFDENDKEYGRKSEVIQTEQTQKQRPVVNDGSDNMEGFVSCMYFDANDPC